jgi:type I restriction enzyme, S subunit
MTAFQTVTVGSLLSDERGISVGVMYPGEDTPEGVPLIRVADIIDSRISHRVNYRISAEVHDQYRRTELVGGECLITLVGRPGIAVKVPDEFSGWNVARALAVLRLREPAAVDYFVYAVASPQVQHTIRNWCNTTVQATLNLKEIRALPLPWPDKGTRQAIAATLGALDDKIELNRRMNDTLEAMARTIFKDWFVDFGPIRAKMDGCAPYLTPEIWSLFPNTLDKDRKPEGWGERRVEDILELAYGKALKASERVPGLIPVYGSGGITGYHNEALVNGPSIVVGRKGTVGSLYWEDRSFFPIDTVFYVKPKAPLTFCFYHLQTLGLEGMNTDAAVPGLNRNNVYRLPVPWSGNELRDQFDDWVMPIRQRMRANSDESEALTATRDFLLPKLMSGEVRVDEAEKIVGEPLNGFLCRTACSPCRT